MMPKWKGHARRGNLRRRPAPAEPVDAGTRRELNALLSRHAVLVFRDQPLTPPQFMQAAEAFGDLMDQQIKKFVLPD